MVRSIETVIFDMDGLMFDSEQLTLNCWIKSGEMMGSPVDPAVARETIGRNIRDTKNIMLEGHGDGFPFETVWKKRDELIISFVEESGTPLKPGLLTLLDFLEKEGIKRVVATSTEKKRAERMLACAGVLHRFDAIIYGDMVERGKPFPDIFQKAAEVCGSDTEACLVLEDSPAGVEAAWRSGMRVFFIQDLIEPDIRTRERYTAKLGDLTEVLPFLNGTREFGE